MPTGPRSLAEVSTHNESLCVSAFPQARQTNGGFWVFFHPGCERPDKRTTLAETGLHSLVLVSDPAQHLRDDDDR